MAFILRSRNQHHLRYGVSLHRQVVGGGKIGSMVFRRNIIVLGIETSCDDTSVALLHRSDPSSKPNPTSPTTPLKTTLLYHNTITSDNRSHRGIHPLTSLDSHRTHLTPLISSALSHLPPNTTKPDLVAVTRGPGMRSSLAVGLDTAKGLAVAWRVPLVGVNHMLGHALSVRLVDALSVGDGDEKGILGFPFWSLLVSGGHTILLKSESVTKHSVLAETVDLAIGDCLDKAARQILTPEPSIDSHCVAYARQLEQFVFPTGPQGYSYHPPNTAERIEQDTLLTEKYPSWHPLPIPFMSTMSKANLMAFSFTGIGSSVDGVFKEVRDVGVEERRWLGRQVMQTAFEHLARRVVLGLRAEAGKLKSLGERIHEGGNILPIPLVLAGGVAANSFLRHILQKYISSELALPTAQNSSLKPFMREVRFVCPPPRFCTDNAAMIAWAGLELWDEGWETELGTHPVRKWGLDSEEDGGGEGKGVLGGVDGWVRREGFEI